MNNQYFLEVINEFNIISKCIIDQNIKSDTKIYLLKSSYKLHKGYLHPKQSLGRKKLLNRYRKMKKQISYNKENGV